jgi:hypothetical protein
MKPTESIRTGVLRTAGRFDFSSRAGFRNIVIFGRPDAVVRAPDFNRRGKEIREICLLVNKLEFSRSIGPRAK